MIDRLGVLLMLTWRELRGWGRSGAAVGLLAVWLTASAALTLVIYRRDSSESGSRLLIEGSRTGGALLEALLLGLLVTVLVAVAVLSAGAISSERERGALGPLLLTGMGSLTLVVAKVLAGVLLAALAVLLVTPGLALAWSMGGVPLSAMATGVGIILLTAAMVGAIGVLVSALSRSTATALVATVSVVAVVSVGAMWPLTASVEGDHSPSDRAMLALSPVVGLAANLDRYGVGEQTMPLSRLREDIDGAPEPLITQFALAADAEGVSWSPPSVAVGRNHLWVAVFVVIAGVALAAQRLSLPLRSGR